ncbi:MAG: SusF/SusE family outer membrane protein [Bacteroidales bacterium]|nr:SusF/SusE family outer membrane protein [Bacteroidales bacterium]
MKKTALLLIPALALVAMTGCEDQDTTPVFQEPTEFVLNTPAYVNGVYDLEQSDNIILTCSQPDYGFTAAVNYSVEVSFGNTFEEGSYAALGSEYTSARMAVDAAELAAALTELSGKTEDQFPIVETVYVRAKAKLGKSGKGEIYSNVITLPSVRIHFALPPVSAPEQLYIVGQFCNWTWDSCTQFIDGYTNAAANGNDGKSKIFWAMIYLPENGGLKINTAKAWDGGEKGYDAVTCVDNAGASISRSDDGNVVVGTAGWYLVVVNASVSGRDILYTINFNEPKVYLIGVAAGGWDVLDDNLFTVPATADGEFVSKAFVEETPADSGVRACVKIDGLDWWQSEFMVFGGKIVYRATGGDQERVVGTVGQKLYLNFSDGTGKIK